VDKPVLDALGKALGAKLGAGDAPADAAAAVWAFATLNYKLDAQVGGKGGCGCTLLGARPPSWVPAGLSRLACCWMLFWVPMGLLVATGKGCTLDA
jgi:hypothetical protein